VIIGGWTNAKIDLMLSRGPKATGLFTSYMVKNGGSDPVMYCGGVFPGDLVDETDGYDGSNDLEASLIVSRCRVTLESSARFGTYLGTSEHKRA